MAKQSKVMDVNPLPTAEEWAVSGWRHVYSWDQREADELRRRLVAMSNYVEGTRNDDPAQHGAETANHRAALHVMAEELAPDDLKVVFDIARRLLICPDQVDVHKLAAERDRRFLAWYELQLQTSRKGRKSRKAAAAGTVTVK